METKSTAFDLQPTLKGKLLELRPLRPDDFHRLYAVGSDPLIWEQHPVKDRCNENVFRKFFQEALDSGGALIAIDSKDGRVIGSSRFYGYDKAKSEVEIGWTFLGRSHWGGVYNREMENSCYGTPLLSWIGLFFLSVQRICVHRGPWKK